MDVDYLIIGAGCAGASTAYHLVQRSQTTASGAARVLVVEKEPVPAAHSSGRNAAQLRLHVDNEAVAALTRQSANLLATGQLAAFRRTGSVLIGLGDEDVSRRFPPARGAGLWCPDDGIIDINGMLATFLHNVDVRYNTEVQGWDASSDASAPLVVHTSRGSICARVVVNAAGPWAGVLGGIPMTPKNRHLFITEPMADIGEDWPFVWDVNNGLYFRPESGGLMLCACDETDADPGCYEEDPEVAERLDDLVRRLQPGLGELSVMRSWVGQRTFAPDRQFVVGYDAREPRLFHVAGLGGSGVSTSPALGALAADLLLRPERAGQANPFDPGRLL